MTDMWGQGSGTLTRAATMVEAARADLAVAAERLDERLATLDTAWRGGGARAFANFQIAWMERYRAIVAALDGFETALRGSESVNVRADDEQVAVFSGAAAGLR